MAHTLAPARRSDRETRFTQNQGAFTKERGTAGRISGDIWTAMKTEQQQFMDILTQEISRTVTEIRDRRSLMSRSAVIEKLSDLHLRVMRRIKSDNIQNQFVDMRGDIL